MNSELFRLNICRPMWLQKGVGKPCLLENILVCLVSVFTYLNLHKCTVKPVFAVVPTEQLPTFKVKYFVIENVHLNNTMACNKQPPDLMVIITHSLIWLLIQVCFFVCACLHTCMRVCVIQIAKVSTMCLDGLIRCFKLEINKYNVHTTGVKQ